MKEMSEKMKRVEETFELHTEEEKLRERKKNNIILHRLVEGERLEDDRENMEEKKMVLCLLNDVLGVPCAEKDIKSVYRLGRYKEGERERPVLVEFRDATIKNRMLESLSKLRGAEEKFKRISITHDMTRTERMDVAGIGAGSTSICDIYK